jgi:hypothetical protein
LAADLIVLQLSEANPHRKAEKNTIRTITADGEVSMNGLDFVATSDRALFQRDPQASEGVLPGTITLTCYAPERLCSLTNQAGDTILSNEIVIDTMTQGALFTNPKGTLKTFDGTFSSKKMVWDDPTSRLTLSGDVVITFEAEDEGGEMIPSRQSYGKLKAANDVRVILTTVDGKKVLHGMDTVGDATLIFIDPETGADYLLKSYGSFRIDHQKMEGKLQSPVNADGSVIEGKQIFFEDAKGQISADKAFVKYAYVDKRLVPTRVVLKGHVKMSNHPERSDTDHTKVDQYILSDRVDFIPQTKEMVFKAAKGERVLLFDQDNHLEVSAQGIKLTRDKAVQKDTIQGLGDVRFNFVESELEQFRHHFPFEKKSEAKK